ncbi:hypothetical protein NE237_026837 [Protea cynaroides]|uniref:Uncharacterized protein n=1 Tax=Protea cynaroides TaxID=273540 RepID=A0A9Q0GPC1_9MAGN|nr:hypothetical protein NE237_026837 [Protea cynaroides]
MEGLNLDSPTRSSWPLDSLGETDRKFEWRLRTPTRCCGSSTPRRRNWWRLRERQGKESSMRSYGMRGWIRHSRGLGLGRRSWSGYWRSTLEKHFQTFCND